MLDVTVRDVSKQFPDGTVALERIDLRVEPGEGVVLLGPNGSGKSTLLRCMVGLEQVTNGSIWVGEVETTAARGRRLREMRGQVGFVFQRFNLVGSLSVFHNALHGALGRSRGPVSWWPMTAPEPERQQAMECLDRVGLGHLAGRRADTLSGGQQQRLALARMLMQSPRMILADEPVANLDPKAGREVMDLLWSIGREQGLTIICALHQLDFAVQYADRLVGLRQGRVALDDRTGCFSRGELEQLYQAEPDGADPIQETLAVAAHG